MAECCAATVRRPEVATPFIMALGTAQIISWGTLYYSFPLIAGPMAAELGLDRAVVYGAATLALTVAALSAYAVGVAIDRGHGRLVLTVGSILGGVSLAGWSQVDGPTGLYLALIGVGFAQAMTLYEAGFAVVAHRYQVRARDGITALSLWGGFASTVFVPVVQLLLDGMGWRDALLVLALVNVGIAALLHGAAVGPAQSGRVQTVRAAGGSWVVVRKAAGSPVFWGLLLAFTFYYGVFSGLTFHLYPMLLERGFGTETVVAAIAVIGPAQVAGRVAIWLLATQRPIRAVGSVAVAIFPVALALLLLLPQNFATLVLFAVLYGATNGVMTIVRGLAVPEMLTREAYGAVNGVLAVPATAAKALAPVAVAAAWVSLGSYEPLLLVGFIGFLLAAAGFWFAARISRRSNRSGEI